MPSSRQEMLFRALFALHYSLKTRELGCHQELCHLPRWVGAGGAEVGGEEVLQVLPSPCTSPY